MDRDQLVAVLDDHLDSDAVADVAVNGLQVAGRARVERLATAVSVSLQLLEEVVDWGADALLVHHGLLWRSEVPPRLVGAYRERIRLLLEHDLSLVAYHLPLDRHPDHGNAAVMARMLGLEQLEPFGEFSGVSLGFAGIFPVPVDVEELCGRVRLVCDREPLLLPGGPERVASVGIVTGGAPTAMEEAITVGLDAFITGEAREWATYRACEEGIHFLAAGHHATERFGVRALGEYLASRFDLSVRFFDASNPV
jgi:dinuclear metal center YbgI/SA1388 family protein